MKERKRRKVLFNGSPDITRSMQTNHLRQDVLIRESDMNPTEQVLILLSLSHKLRVNNVSELLIFVSLIFLQAWFGAINKSIKSLLRISGLNWERHNR